MSKNKDELIIHVMHGYDSLEAPDGTKCFGVYIKDKNEIYVASDIPDNQLFHTMAHEYCHYLQDLEGREFDEEEADMYADNIVSMRITTEIAEYILEQCRVAHLGTRRHDGVEYHECVDLDRLQYLLEKVLQGQQKINKR